MSRVFITGSSTGLGLMARRLLAEQGHRIVLHARDEQRASDKRRFCPYAIAVLPEVRSKRGSCQAWRTPAAT